jgi:hypothetical protein
LAATVIGLSFAADMRKKNGMMKKFDIVSASTDLESELFHQVPARVDASDEPERRLRILDTYAA